MKASWFEYEQHGWTRALHKDRVDATIAVRCGAEVVGNELLVGAPRGRRLGLSRAILQCARPEFSPLGLMDTLDGCWTFIFLYQQKCHQSFLT